MAMYLSKRHKPNPQTPPSLHTSHIFHTMLRLAASRNLAQGAKNTFARSTFRSSIAQYSHAPPVTEIQDVKHFVKFTDSEVPSVIDFYATWCGPCKAISPVFDKLAHAIPEAQFARVDVDIAHEVAIANEITAMPTLKLFKHGKETGKIVGADLQQLVKLIQEATDVDVKLRL